MHPRAHSAAFVRLSIVALAVATLSLGAANAAPAPAPAAAVTPAALPSSPCVLSGSTRTCEVWARTGTLALPGQVTPLAILGYASSAAGAAQMPGPLLLATAGESVQIILHNTLSTPTALSLPGQPLPSDRTGVPAGGSKTYSFTAGEPGTWMYQAGLLTDGPRQVTMGLAGAFVVRPASCPTCLYDQNSAFDDEALLVLNEIDPAFNSSFSSNSLTALRDFRPAFRLLNGQPFPQTTPVVLSGSRVGLRILNAGIVEHSFGLLGLHQRVVGSNGKLAQPYEVVSETLGPGVALDSLVTLPGDAPAGARYAVYETAHRLDNSGQRRTDGTVGFGGMLIFFQAPGAATGADRRGPLTSGLTLSPTSTSSPVAVAISATISDATTGNANVTAAEYFIDTVGTSGSGAALQGTFGSPSVDVSGNIPANTIGGLIQGVHAVYVHGVDAAGNWGPTASAALTINGAVSPATTRGVVLTPANTNGSAAISVDATGDDSAAGGTVDAGEYFIDTVGSNGAGQQLASNQATVAALTGSLPAATVAALSEGSHTLSVHSHDSANTWGPYATATFTVDKTAPMASAVTVRPSPNDGKTPFDASALALTVRIDATAADATNNGVNSPIAGFEGFLDTVGATGSGFLFNPVDGQFNTAQESGYALMPLAQLNALPDGGHTVYVHAQDTAGNWGPTASGTLVIDRKAPTVTGVSSSPSLANGGSFTLTAQANDPAPSSAIARAEWFEGTDPGAGTGHPMQAADGAFNSAAEALTATVSTSGMTPGAHTLSVRAADGASNWSPVATGTVTVADTVFANSFESGNTAQWSSTTGNNVRVTAAATMSGAGSYGMRVTLAGNNPGYVTDTTPAAEKNYHARFYFNPNGTPTGGSAQDIFVGRSANNTVIFRVQYQRVGANTYQIRAGEQRQGGFTYTNWYTVTNAAHAVEIGWQSANVASFSLRIDGTLRQTLNNLNTNAYTLEEVRLGPSAGLNNQTNGTEYFDAFVSTRTTVIGP